MQARHLYRIAKWRLLRAKNVFLRYGREHTLSLTAVILLHAAFFLVIVWASSLTIPRPPAKDLQAVLFQDRPEHRPEVTPPEVAFPVVAPPQIVIEPDETSHAIATVSSALVLPPHPDPERVNEQPKSPEAGTLPIVVLKILVSPDGSVTDAQTVPPLSHDPVAEEAALTWVKARWHFIPAMHDTVAVPYWTTVSVRFSAAH